MEMLADEILSSRCLAPAEDWHGSSSFRLRGLSASEAKNGTVNIDQARLSSPLRQPTWKPAIHAFDACSMHHSRQLLPWVKSIACDFKVLISCTSMSAVSNPPLRLQAMIVQVSTGRSTGDRQVGH